MLPRTVFHGSSASCWNMYDARRLRPVSSLPNTSTRPPVGGVRPAMMFKSVDFPQPLGPTNETNVPAATSSVTLSTAMSAPNRLTTSRNARAGVSAHDMESFRVTSLTQIRSCRFWRYRGGPPGPLDWRSRGTFQPAPLSPEASARRSRSPAASGESLEDLPLRSFARHPESSRELVPQDDPVPSACL